MKAAEGRVTPSPGLGGGGAGGGAREAECPGHLDADWRLWMQPPAGG